MIYSVVYVTVVYTYIQKYSKPCMFPLSKPHETAFDDYYVPV